MEEMGEREGGSEGDIHSSSFLCFTARVPTQPWLGQNKTGGRSQLSYVTSPLERWEYIMKKNKQTPTTSV